MSSEITLNYLNFPFQIKKDDGTLIQVKQRSTNLTWNNIEKSKYLIFVSYFRDFFIFKTKNKQNWKLFKGMSKLIQTKNPQQCRSQHLKIIKEYKFIERFLEQALKKYKSLTHRIMDQQKKLQSIQVQFNLFKLKQQIQQNEECQFGQKTNQSQVKILQKQQKNEIFKTSDSYCDEKYNEKNKKNRPSFSFQESNNIDIEQNIESSFPIYSQKPFQNLKKNHQKNQKINQNRDNKAIQRLQEQRNRLKLQKIYECQYLYSLWSKKLSQIMSQPSLYNIKGWNN